MIHLVYAIILFFISQSILWFQINGQFIYPVIEKNPLLVSLGSVLVTYIMIMGTKHTYAYFDGVIWPGRFIGFGIGIIIFAFLTYYFMGESINFKTLVSVLLAVTILGIQILWKV